MSVSNVSYTMIIVILAVFLFVYVVFKMLKLFAAVKQQDDTTNDDNNNNIIESTEFVDFCKDVKVRQAAIRYEIAIDVFREVNRAAGTIQQPQQAPAEEPALPSSSTPPCPANNHELCSSSTISLECENGKQTEEEEPHDEVEQFCDEGDDSNYGKKKRPALLLLLGRGHHHQHRHTRQPCYKMNDNKQVGQQEQQYLSSLTRSANGVVVATSGGDDAMNMIPQSFDSCSDGGEKENNDLLCCAICLESLLYGQKVAWSKKNKNCAHLFHQTCLTTWLERKSDCPCCREILLHDNTFLQIYTSDHHHKKNHNESSSTSSRFFDCGEEAV